MATTIAHSHFKYTRKAQEAVAVNATFITLTTIAIAVRFYVRTFMLAKHFGLDDLLILLGASFAILECVASLVSVRFGLGQNVKDVSTTDMAAYIKANFGASLSYQPALAFTRLSILAFYYRHLKPRGTSFLRISILSLSAFIVAMLVWGLLVVILQCRPISYQWTRVHPDAEGKCLQLVPFYYVHASIGLFCDVAVYALPIRTLWGLNLPKRQRQGLVFVFALGAFVCVSSAVRIRYLHRLLNSRNPTVTLVGAINWSSAEINLGIVCASIPTYKPLLKKYFPSGGEIASALQSLVSSVTPSRSSGTKSAVSRGNTNEFGDGDEMVEWSDVVRQATNKSENG